MKKSNTEQQLELEKLAPEVKDPFHKVHYWKRLSSCSKELLAVAVESTDEILYMLRSDTRAPSTAHRMHFA
jgi:hypothetical protein